MFYYILCYLVGFE